MKRWQKTLQLDEALVDELKKIKKLQKWIIIVEPWCGDAAASLPFTVRLAQQNSCIEYDLQLRDQEPFLINSYLTRGARSIPKLIVGDEAGKQLFTWGPRPGIAQELLNELKANKVDYDTLNTQMQNWYNKDRGGALQKELLQLFRGVKFQIRMW